MAKAECDCGVDALVEPVLWNECEFLNASYFVIFWCAN